jgi:hypothetical protein
MPNKQNNTLIIGVNAVYFLGRATMMWPASATTRGFYIRIDTITPQIWLPTEICEIFERAFDLKWDENLQLYLVDHATRSRLLQENPSVVFLLGADVGGSAATYKNFTLPYSAFDLRLGPPLVTNTTYYFPLRRAKDPGSYMFGRAFLQETYLTVDYERTNFSISQAYPTGGSAYIVPILSVIDPPATSNNTGATTDVKRSALSTGAQAGIGVGVGLFALALAILFLSWKRGWGFFRKPFIAPDPVVKAELHGKSKPRLEAMEKEQVELADEQTAELMERGAERAELETVEPRLEAGGPTSSTIESINALHEMDGDQARTA